MKTIDHMAKARSAAHPVTFDNTIGLFQPSTLSSASVAVLFLSPWGLEEMFTRKVWRTMAEALADQGIASLRFDYPGTGDALDLPDYPEGIETWAKSAVAAGDQLKTLSGCTRIVLISQGLGAAIATLIAKRLKGVEAIAFLAPVISGRAYVRELQFWSRMIDDGLGLTDDQRQTDGVSIAGLTIAAEIAADVRKINLTTLAEFAVPKCLVGCRGDRPADIAFAGQLRALGSTVEEIEYGGYDAMVSNPSVSRVPLQIVEDVVAWTAAIAGEQEAAGKHAVSSVPIALPSGDDTYRETPVTFGRNNRLFGVLCEPRGKRRGATALLLGTAYDRSAGWGRMGVSMARQLASDGIASLRFDAANIADSPPCEGESEQVLYNASQLLDIREAKEFLDDKLPGPSVLAGRCSAGYQAFRAAVGDEKFRGAVLVNPYVFEWDPGRNVDEALTAPPRSLDTYKQRLFQAETFRRLISGRIDVGQALVNIMKAVGKRLSHVARPLLDLLPGYGDEHRRVSSSFRTLADRDVKLTLLYSENDVGCDHLIRHFGKDGAGLRKYPNVELGFIPGSDHNLTPESARRRYIEAVRDVALNAAP